MKSRIAAAVGLSLALASGLHGVAKASDVSRIFGTWVPVGFTPQPNLPGVGCGASLIVFTARTQAVTLSNHPDWPATPLNVSYVARPNSAVAVIGNTGHAVTYRFIDNNHITGVEDLTQCIYARRS